jgi:hypothetical protein
MFKIRYIVKILLTIGNIFLLLSGLLFLRKYIEIPNEKCKIVSQDYYNYNNLYEEPIKECNPQCIYTIMPLNANISNKCKRKISVNNINDLDKKYYIGKNIDCYINSSLDNCYIDITPNYIIPYTLFILGNIFYSCILCIMIYGYIKKEKRNKYKLVENKNIEIV